MITDDDLIERAIDYLKDKTCVDGDALDYLDHIAEQLRDDEAKEFLALLGDNLC